MHTPSQAYKVLPSNVVVALDTPSWTRPVHSNLVKMQLHWLIQRTQQYVRPTSDEEGAKKVREILKKNSTQDFIALLTFDKSNMDRSLEVQSPQIKWEKRINIQMLITMFCPVNPVDLILSPVKFSMIGGIPAQIYTFIQVISYPPRLHITISIDIKMILDCCFLRLFVKHEGKKKGVNLYYNK